MASRNTTRRPNRRQLTPGQLRNSPLAIVYAAPTHNGPNTVFELALTSSNARVTNQAGTPEVARIYLLCFIAGGPQQLPALEVGNEGEGPDGTLIQITFAGNIDLTSLWQLYIPTDTALIQSKNGGFLNGSFANGQDPAVAANGYVVLNNTQNCDFPFPGILTVTSITGGGTNNLYLHFDDQTPGAWVLGSTPNWPSSTNVVLNTCSDPLDGTLHLIYDSPVAVGEFIQIDPWNVNVRGSAGQWVLPSFVLVT